VHGFISSNRVADFISQFKLQIIQKLIPGLRKDGYLEDSPDTSTNASGSNRDSRSRPEAPVADHYPNHPLSHIPPENPLQIGRRDLDPIPMNPINPFAPPPLFPPHGGDGMFVGPDHPIFGNRRGRGDSGVQGPWGGDGFLPPLGAPPGARFDPVGPHIGNLHGRGRGPARRNIYSPDNDEFMPPGAVRLILCYLYTDFDHIF
jgi:proteasome inhibitor subunit 1 (PI31)